MTTSTPTSPRDGSARTPVQLAATEAARNVLEAPADLAGTPAPGDPGVGGGSDRWQALADAGVVAAMMPEEVGGASAGWVGLHDLLVAVGRAGGTEPALETLALGLLPVLAAGGHALRERVVDNVVAGGVVTAVVSPAAPSAAPLATRGPTWDASTRRLAGTMGPVPHLAGATHVVVSAAGGDGRVVAVLDTTWPQVRVTPTATLGLRSDAMLEVDVILPSDHELASGVAAVTLDAWRRAWLQAGAAALQSGLCDGAVGLTASHVRGREQFGRPIGSFQAVAQRLADAEIALRCLRLVAAESAWLLDHAANTAPTTGPADATLAPPSPGVARACARAAWWAAEVGHQVAHAAQHLHGGHGMDLSYRLPTFFRALTATEYLVGGAGGALTELALLDG